MSKRCTRLRFAPLSVCLGLAGIACGSAVQEEAASVQQGAQKPGPGGFPIIRGYFWKASDVLLPEGDPDDVRSVAIQATPSLIAAFGTSDSAGGTVQVRTYSNSTQLWDATAVLPGRYAALSNDVLAVGTPSVDVKLYHAPIFGTHATLTPNVPVASSEFGRSLAMDGPTLVVGAPSYNAEEGRAFIFELVEVPIRFIKRFVWQQTAMLGGSSPAAIAVTPIAESFLGAAVGVSGAVVAVGQTPDAPDANGRMGRVFLFEKQANAWSLVDTVFAHDPNTAQIAANSDVNAQNFGKALVVKGDVLAVRSDRYVQLFSRDTSSGAVHWLFTQSFDVGLSSSSFWDRPLAFDGEELVSGDSFEESYAGRLYPLMGTLAHAIPNVPPNPFIEESPSESGALFGQCLVTAGGWLLVGDRRSHVRVYARTPFY